MGGKGSGPKRGSKHAGSLMHLIEQLAPGAHLWTEQRDQSVSGSAARAGMRVSTTRFAAVNSQTLEIIRLYRITREA